MSEKIQKIISEIENLNVIELNDLIKQLEEKFGPAPSYFPVTAPVKEEAKEETAPSKVNVVLVDSGANKIQIIKIIRELNPNLGLKEAKYHVDNPPQVIKESVDLETANKIKEKIETAGGRVEFK